jgi:DNA polymerase I-like protein with 3'-5' exonuclease and polymerase domains
MAPYREIEMEKFFPSLKMTLRGTLTDQVYKNKLKGELLVKINERERWLEDVLGHPFNQGSPIQMQRLFYTDFKVRPVISRKTRRPTCDDEALEEIARRQPLLRPLVEVIQEIRSLNIFYNNYAEAVLDKDGRMRATFHFIPESFRFSCSKNAFDTGINMQTISKGNEDD